MYDAILDLFRTHCSRVNFHFNEYTQLVREDDFFFFSSMQKQ